MRISLIEAAIESHLISIHGRKRMQEFKGIEVPVKLRYLIENFTWIDEHKRMRIIDQVQSYNILDSEGYNKIKPVEIALDENKEFSLDGKSAQQQKNALLGDIEFTNLATIKS